MVSKGRLTFETVVNVETDSSETDLSLAAPRRGGFTRAGSIATLASRHYRNVWPRNKVASTTRATLKQHFFARLRALLPLHYSGASL